MSSWRPIIRVCAKEAVKNQLGPAGRAVQFLGEVGQRRTSAAICQRIDEAKRLLLVIKAHGQRSGRAPQRVFASSHASAQRMKTPTAAVSSRKETVLSCHQMAVLPKRVFFSRYCPSSSIIANRSSIVAMNASPLSRPCTYCCTISDCACPAGSLPVSAVYDANCMRCAASR